MKSYYWIPCVLLLFGSCEKEPVGPVDEPFVVSNVIWERIGLDSVSVFSLAINGDHVFAATSAGVFLSRDNGMTWKAANSGLPEFNLNEYHWVNKVATVPDGIGGTNVLCGPWDWDAGLGLFLSTNDGTNWNLVMNGLSSDIGITSFAVTSGDFGVQHIFAATYRGVFVSTNGGVSWGETTLDTIFVTSLAVSGTSLVAGTTGAKIYRSTDNGASWAVMNNGVTDGHIYSLGVLSTNLFAGTQFASFRSTDGGTTWIEMTSLANEFVNEFAPLGTNLLAGTNSARIYLSTDDGLTWSRADSGVTRNVLSFAFVGSTILAGTEGGVFKGRIQ